MTPDEATAGQLFQAVYTLDQTQQLSSVQSLFPDLLQSAAQVKSSTGKPRLAAFLDLCAKCDAPVLRAWVFSEATVLAVVDAYLRWGEAGQDKLAKRVLDAVHMLILQNPSASESLVIREKVAAQLARLAAKHTSKPLVKGALKTLDQFLAKNILDLAIVGTGFAQAHDLTTLTASSLHLWQRYLDTLLQWMTQHFICQVAGKLIATLYMRLRRESSPSSSSSSSSTPLLANHPLTPSIFFHQVLLPNLDGNLSLIQGISSYIFLPLFKTDREEALAFLEPLNVPPSTAQFFYPGPSPSSSRQPLQHHDSPVLLQLAALEVGRRLGLVEEPGYDALVNAESKQETTSQPSKKQTKSPRVIILRDDVLQNALSHLSCNVRSLALAMLLTCSSTTRPYSPETLTIVQRYLRHFFAESDAKFRMEFFNACRNMYKRVRCAMTILRRSIVYSKSIAARESNTTTTDSSKQLSSLGKGLGAPHHARTLNLPLEDLEGYLALHKSFLEWYLALLLRELTPTASYQRHISSLKILAQILRLEADDNNQLWELLEVDDCLLHGLDGSWTRALLDLLMDPFEDVRDTASSILQTILTDPRYVNVVKTDPAAPSNIPKLETAKTWAVEFIRRADKIACETARAYHGDGLARSYELLFRLQSTTEERMNVLETILRSLERKLVLAEADLGKAIVDAPIHVEFAALSYIAQVYHEHLYSATEVTQLQQHHQRIVLFCQRIWTVVRDILCDDSPEGHLPEDMEEMDGLDTKDVLSYSFRTVIESSKLMRVIALGAKNRSIDQAGRVSPSFDLFAEIGNMSFLQLSSLRHRGAFTQISQTFATCCQQSLRFNDAEPKSNGDGGQLLQQWYQGALQGIYSQGSTTRRSAGIPALFTGILSAKAASPSLDDVIHELMRIGQQKAESATVDATKLPQVHALNCLKDIFKSSQLAALGGRSDVYISKGLELAAASMRADVWAIRNCGLLLLRSLVDGLFGTNESKSMIEAGYDGRAHRIQYSRYPSIPGVLLSLLQQHTKRTHELGGNDLPSSTSTIDLRGNLEAAESVFPALDILRRAGPPEALRDELQGHVVEYLGSPVWHVREIAARTLCSFLLHEGWLDTIRTLLQEAVLASSTPEGASVGGGQNRMHGTYLVIKYVVEKLAEVMPERLSVGLGDLLSLLLDEKLAHPRFPSPVFPEIYAVYVEIFTLLYTFASFIPSDVAEATSLASVILASDSIYRDEAKSKTPGPLRSTAPGALLRRELARHVVIRLGVAASVNKSLAQESLDTLIASVLQTAADFQTSALMAMLEAIPAFWISENKPEVAAQLASLLYVRLLTTQTEGVSRDRALDSASRAEALLQLSQCLDIVLQSRDNAKTRLPEVQDVERVWTSLQKDALDTRISQAIVRSSGSMVAAILRSNPSAAPLSVASFGGMMADAGLDDQSFDTRLAAAQSLRSFCIAMFSCSSARGCISQALITDEYLPILLSLYDALNDDDDEIRDEAALAAAAVLASTETIAPLEAAQRLLQWLIESPQLRNSPLLWKIVSQRIVGWRYSQIASSDGKFNATALQIPTFSEQLLQSCNVDQSLFAVEEQNLFIDELRESYRWSEVLKWLAIQPSGNPSTPGPLASAEVQRVYESLRAWAIEGLTLLVKTLQEDDVQGGPLGWSTSSPDLFAVCSQLLITGSSIVQVAASGDDAVSILRDLLEKIQSVGKAKQISQLLLDLVVL